MSKNIYKVDIVVIGAGIVGLSIADKLSIRFENILVIEKERTIKRDFGKLYSEKNYYVKNK